jgi:hypothetical protein
MGKYAENCVKMFLREDEKPRPHRPGTWIFGQEYRYQTDYFKGAPCLVEYIPIYAETPKPNANEPVARRIANVERDGHKGGAMTGQIRHEAEMLWFFIGTDPANPRVLGAHVEFHIGEGEDREIFEFDEPACVLVPRGVANTGLYITNMTRWIMNVNIFNQPSKDGAYIEHLYYTTEHMRK